MKPYRNLSGESNVVSYESAADSIHVVFRSGTHRNYLYNSTSPGQATVNQMKALAEQGQGLNAYISRVVKSNFARKW